MMPNIDPRQLKRMMDSMGMKNTEIEAHQVIIKCSGKDIIIDNPSVTLVEMQDNRTYNVSGGTVTETDTAAVAIDPEDVEMVMKETGVTDEARVLKALEDAKGDIAQAILNLKQG